MVLKLRKDAAPEECLTLSAGVRLWVCPAEMFEHLEAERAASELIAGLITGQDAAMRASALLGRQFRDADFTDRAWAHAAAQSLILLELAVRCVTRWENIVDEDGNAIEEPSREYLALLLRDREIAIKIGLAMQRRIHEESAEKNGLAASPNGGAEAETTVADATSSTSPVRGA